jgi:hypothetical protein
MSDPEEPNDLNAILSDILANISRLSPDFYPYSPETYSFSFDFLRTCGMAALD